MGTKIEWATETWNPITGCTKISEGCQNCYAERMAKRLAGRYGYPKDEPFRVTFHPDRLYEPFRWKKPRMVFACSMSDVFHKEVEDNWVDRIIAAAAICSKHTFLLLTKRPSEMLKYFSNPERPFLIQSAIDNAQVELSDSPEEWRPIVGYESVYEVSNLGRVRRCDSNKKGRRRPDGILRPRSVKGYNAVSLSLNGFVKQFRVPQLVLTSFVGPVPQNAEARHWNGKKTDDRLSNLVWGTRSDNMGDASRHGTAGTWMKSRSKFTHEQVSLIRRRRSAGEKLISIANDFGTTIKHISAICLGTKYVLPKTEWPLPNIWLGVTAENQQRADERIPVLLQIPAAVRFVSVEPMLSRINMEKYLRCPNCGYSKTDADIHWDHQLCSSQNGWYPNVIDWVVCGGETGPGARQMKQDWVYSLRNQCEETGTPFFFKKWGNNKRRDIDGKLYEQMPHHGRR